MPRSASPGPRAAGAVRECGQVRNSSRATRGGAIRVPATIPEKPQLCGLRVTRRPDAGATDRVPVGTVVVVGCRVSAVISPYRRRVVRVTCRLSFRRGDTERCKAKGRVNDGALDAGVDTVRYSRTASVAGQAPYVTPAHQIPAPI